MARQETVSYRNVGIESIDQAVTDWFDKTLSAHVDYPNGDRKRVPVVFATGERWAAGRQRRGMRDDNGVLILPIISIRRIGIDLDPRMGALGAQDSKITVTKRISRKTNQLQNNDVLRGPALHSPMTPAVYEVTTIPFPDSSIFRYELKIQTQYVLQMNAIIEKLIHELDIQKTFVAPFENDNRHSPSAQSVDFENRKPVEGGYVVGFFDQNMSDTGNFEEFTDQERIVQYVTNFTVPATLQLDPEGEEPSVKVERTAFGLRFTDESVTVVETLEDLEKIFGPTR